MLFPKLYTFTGNHNYIVTPAWSYRKHREVDNALLWSQVLHVSVFVQSDGNYAAHVKVPSLQDAQYAISQLHRRKLGYKRILISYANSGGPSPQLVRYVHV